MQTCKVKRKEFEYTEVLQSYLNLDPVKLQLLLRLLLVDAVKRC